MRKSSISSLALYLTVSARLLINSPHSMEVDLNSTLPETSISPVQSMDIETKEKTTKRKLEEYLDFYFLSPAEITFSLNEIRALIFNYLNEKDQESVLLTTRDGHQQLLKIYDVKNIELNVPHEKRVDMCRDIINTLIDSYGFLDKQMNNSITQEFFNSAIENLNELQGGDAGISQDPLEFFMGKVTNQLTGILKVKSLDDDRNPLKIYKSQLYIPEWHDLPGLTSRMNYGINKTTATFLGLFNNLYNDRGKAIDKQRFLRMFNMFEILNTHDKNIILHDYATLLKTLIMKEKPTSEKMDVLKKPIKRYLKEETKNKTLLRLYEITANETNFFNEKAIYIHYCIFSETQYARPTYQIKIGLDKIKETAVYAEDTFLMVNTKNLLLCENFYETFSFSRTTHHWDQIITLDPGAPVDVFKSAAKAHLSAKNYAQSSKYFDRAITLQGVVSTKCDYTASGNAHYNAKNYDQAALRYDKALELLESTATGDDYTNAGNAYYKLKKFDQAIKHYEKALKPRGNNSPYIYYINMGDAHYQLKNFEQAAKYYDEGHLRNHTHFSAKTCHYINAGYAHYQLNNYEKAAHYYDQARKRPGYKPCLNHYVYSGNAHYFSQNYEKALFYYEKILRLKKDKALSSDYSIAGDIYFNLKEFQNAAEYYDKAIALKGIEADADDHEKAGDAYFKAKDFHQAANHYDKTIELRGVRAPADDHRKAGNAHHLANNLLQATQNLDRVLVLGGNETTSLDYIRAADAHFDSQNFLKAAVYYNMAIDLKKEHSTAKYYMVCGDAYFKAESFKKAAERYDEGIKLKACRTESQDLHKAIAAHGHDGNFDMVKKYIKPYFEKSDSVNVDLIWKTMALLNEGRDEEAFGLFVQKTKLLEENISKDEDG